MGLQDILGVIGGEGLDWTLHWVWAVGPPPSRWIDWPIHDFEQLVRTAEGVQLSWRELREWANGLQDLQDIELTGRLSPGNTSSDGELGELVYFVDGFDSSVWIIKSKTVIDISSLSEPT
ncbi:hypothetical protein [Deinococcus altitudinis]|uniref:hypothetical protein n=1 Tax=Deinococcus altitudinis TaxID=468914 RepID=UPI0038917997